ncbi:MAG: exodeoxyribonuclease VII large subunit [Dehalococcoidia bacterium]|nr:exodeoxyribonuclease VII large subunit [Dehalococcoidia bacterium]
MQALTVSALVSFLREILEANEILADLWVAGEVSSYSRSQLGHRYFSLRDAGATLRAVLFRDTMAGLRLKDGDRVLVHGRVSVYPQRGELQFVCDFVRPEGVGLLAAKFEQLRQRLEAEGLFAPERKRPLPRFPRRIGIVTSPAGAALQDVKHVLARRWPLAELVLAPAMVQGEHAAAQIAAALRGLAREPGLDLALVARGGGASEDLSAFNDEAVVRAIFGFPVPVVAGVGHETDVTLADLVADLRAPTPSAAAERATPDVRELGRALLVVRRAMESAIRERVAGEASRVEGAIGRMERGGPDPMAALREVEALRRTLAAGLERRCAADRARFEHARARMASLDPRATLARGFAIVQHAQTRKVVTSVRRVRPGARLSVAVSDGAFWTEVS